MKNGKGRGKLSDLYLEKFPVVTETGNEYLAVIKESDMFDKTVEVFLIEQYEHKGLFGRVKTKYKQLNKHFIGGGRLYDEKSWEYDYKAMAINEAVEYEKRIKERSDHEANRKKGAKRFEEWDGKE